MGGRTHGKTTEMILTEIKQYHPDLLYDKFDYKNCNTKMVIGCHEHGYFEKYPNDMKKGRGGCPRCNQSYHKTHEEFIIELKALFPHIECLGTYKNAKSKLQFKCVKHHYLFETNPNGILSGHLNCPECYSQKQTDTKVQKGQITDPGLKSEYELYRQSVWRFSNRTYKKHLSNQKRNRQNHLDHVLSIVEGFQNKVPPEIMGSIHNLRIINGQANRHKSYKSEITVQQLYERYYR
jgi:hypothetical protein